MVCNGSKQSVQTFPTLFPSINQRHYIRMRLTWALVIEQGELEVNFSVTVIIVFDCVEKTVVIAISVLDDFFYSWREWFLGRGFPATMELPIFIYGPHTPLSTGEMKFSIKHTDVEFAATRVVFIKFAAVAKTVSLWMSSYSRLLAFSDHVSLSIIFFPAPFG